MNTSDFLFLLCQDEGIGVCLLFQSSFLKTQCTVSVSPPIFMPHVSTKVAGDTERKRKKMEKMNYAESVLSVYSHFFWTFLATIFPLGLCGLVGLVAWNAGAPWYIALLFGGVPVLLGLLYLSEIREKRCEQRALRHLSQE